MTRYAVVMAGEEVACGGCGRADVLTTQLPGEPPLCETCNAAIGAQDWAGTGDAALDGLFRLEGRALDCRLCIDEVFSWPG